MRTVENKTILSNRYDLPEIEVNVWSDTQKAYCPTRISRYAISHYMAETETTSILSLINGDKIDIVLSYEDLGQKLNHQTDRVLDLKDVTGEVYEYQRLASIFNKSAIKRHVADGDVLILTYIATHEDKDIIRPAVFLNSEFNRVGFAQEMSFPYLENWESYNVSWGSKTTHGPWVPLSKNVFEDEMESALQKNVKAIDLRRLVEEHGIVKMSALKDKTLCVTPATPWARDCINL